MVLYGNNYNSKFNLSTAALVALAAVIITLIWNTITDNQASKEGDGEQALSLDAASLALLVLSGASLVFIAVGIVYTIVSAHLWPVAVKDLMRVLAGHPGSLLELAHKCNSCGVSILVTSKSKDAQLKFTVLFQSNAYTLKSVISGASSPSYSGGREV